MSENPISEPKVVPIAASKGISAKSKAPIYEMIAKAICRDGPQSIPEFPVKLHIVEHVRGEPVIYEEMPGQVLQRRGDDFVAEQILKYVTFTTVRRKVLLDAREARNCAGYWKLYAPRLIEDIMPVAQKSEIGFTFHRLPWDFFPGLSPTWDELFSRMENAEAIMAWIGSLFVHNSERQQYVWIFGEGGNGKGAINRFLKHCFNGAYKSESVPERGDKFWTSNLLNARIVVFGDCNNYNFPTTGVFKQITGDDPIKVEFKGENAFSAELVCKLLFLSNKRPNISGQNSDTRRAIFSEIAPINGEQIPTKIYDRMLRDEGAAFLHKCAETYRRLCPEDGFIPNDQNIISQLVDDNEECLEIITLKNFEIESEEQRLRPAKERWFISPMRLHHALDQLKMDDHKRRAYIEFIQRKFGVRKMRPRTGKENTRDGRECRYIGMRPKVLPEQESVKTDDDSVMW